MELSYKNIPDFDLKEAERKAKKLWNGLCEDKIEITFVTSPLGLMLMAAGVAAIITISKCAGKIEKKSAMKKAKKACTCEEE